MKLFIVARHKEVIPGYRKELKKLGFDYSKENPDIIISLGGDGTYLVAEHLYPGTPKLLIRDKNICNKCSVAQFSPIIKNLKDKKYKVEEFIKIEGTYQKETLVAANDIIIRNKNQRMAVRFRVVVNNIPIRHEYIGDGVVLSTPWGATGYFHTITKRLFKKGIGIALNNTNTERNDIVVKEDSKIEIIITRGDAILTFDNIRKEYILKTGDKLVVRRHKKEARIVYIKK